MPIKIPVGIIDKKNIIEGECISPAGHCYGSDGGSGIPQILKVAEGQGGDIEVWETNKDQLISKAVYSKCQYCGKGIYVKETKDSPKISTT